MLYKICFLNLLGKTLRISFWVPPSAESASTSAVVILRVKRWITFCRDFLYCY